MPSRHLAARGSFGCPKTGLNSADLPIGTRGIFGAPGWIRTSTKPLLRRWPRPVGLRAHIGSGTAPTKRELSKIWRKAGDSNAYVPRDSGLANQWDTNYPSLPGTTDKWFTGKLRTW